MRQLVIEWEKKALTVTYMIAVSYLIIVSVVNNQFFIFI